MFLYLDTYGRSVFCDDCNTLQTKFRTKLWYLLPFVLCSSTWGETREIGGRDQGRGPGSSVVNILDLSEGRLGENLKMGILVISLYFLYIKPPYINY